MRRLGDYVRWKGGIWKVIAFPMVTSQRVRLRWVRGSRPDAGILHDAPAHETKLLADMEVIALMADDEIVP